MHKQTEWKDSVTQYPNRRTLTQNGDGTVDIAKAQGEVITQGTPQSATNFNNIENGVQDGYIAEQLHIIRQRLKEDEVDGRLSAHDKEFTPETGTITLTNSLKFPFNNSQQTVNIATVRKNLNYDVTYIVTAATGLVGDIVISDKQLNGFKIAFEGSGTSVTIAYKVKGGMI